MRAPLQPQADPKPAFQDPSSEIALQQQLLKQRRNSNSSPAMVPSSPFGGSAHQRSDPTQLHMGSAAAGESQYLYVLYSWP